MKYRKGSTIAEWETCKIVPLFDPDECRQPIGLPSGRDKRIYTEQRQLLDGWRQEISKPVLSFIQRILKSMDSWDHTVPSIVVALHLVVAETGHEWFPPTEEQALDTDKNPFPTSLLKQSWKLVQNKISYDFWKRFALMIFQCIHIVAQEHPLMTYATDHVPYLSNTELDTVVTALQLNTSSRSPIAIQQLIRDLIANEPTQIVAVLPPRTCSLNSYTHSCLPTAHVECSRDGTVSLTALYDIESDDNVSIRYVRDGAVEQRDATLQYRSGQSCLCLLCKYEFSLEMVDTKLQISWELSRTDLVRLGHYFIAQEKFDVARQLYRQALDHPCSTCDDESSVVDICHALGAIELSMGNFLKAQRIWQKVLTDYPIACSFHAGLKLQSEKMNCYSYFCCENSCYNLDPIFQWKSPTPGCFVTPVLDSPTCQKVIRWAEELGVWTKQRHYEVPTFDVPIHTVPPMLDWFQNQFMQPLMEHLLAQQFQTSNHGRFYVHDAFCVRYESRKVSNHLPIHTDEATHSLVVSLNDDFDGGGTYLHDCNITLRPAEGSVLSFRGDQMLHGGEAVTRGVRYILAVFLYYDEDSIDDISSKETKRSATELNKLLTESKRQKSDFSFNFDCHDGG
jgi:hypothetical protein